MLRPRNRWVSACVGIVAGLGWSASGLATWSSVQQVTIGTAQILEQERITFGVVAPIAFGVTNRLMLETHPIFDLLFAPNVAGRYRLFEGRHGLVSATGHYRQSFYAAASSQTTSAGQSGSSQRAPGQLELGLVATAYLGQSWALTVSPAYSGRIGANNTLKCQVNSVGSEADCGSLSHGASLVAQAHWLAGEADLLMLTGLFRFDATDRSFETPTATVAWIHHFRSWLGGAHLVVGLSVGEFDIGPLLGSEPLGSWPVFPLVDLWWRL